mmetsp:Transcript_6639/g.16298  ORF Transcript_6639/g.16298 Transcript_6639/m.16298 type:complete len:270 (-) Transcript_6639:39-848(-)
MTTMTTMTTMMMMEGHPQTTVKAGERARKTMILPLQSFLPFWVYSHGRLPSSLASREALSASVPSSLSSGGGSERSDQISHQRLEGNEHVSMFLARRTTAPARTQRELKADRWSRRSRQTLALASRLLRCLLMRQQIVTVWAWCLPTSSGESCDSHLGGRTTIVLLTHHLARPNSDVCATGTASVRATSMSADEAKAPHHRSCSSVRAVRLASLPSRSRCTNLPPSDFSCQLRAPLDDGSSCPRTAPRGRRAPRGRLTRLAAESRLDLS